MLIQSASNQILSRVKPQWVKLSKQMFFAKRLAHSECRSEGQICRHWKVEMANNIIGTQQRSAGVRQGISVHRTGYIGMGTGNGQTGRTWGREGWEKLHVRAHMDVLRLFSNLLHSLCSTLIGVQWQNTHGHSWKKVVIGWGIEQRVVSDQICLQALSSSWILVSVKSGRGF